MEQLYLLANKTGMTLRIVFFIFISGILFTSCIPTEDLIYLQNKDKSGANNPISPVVSKPYRVQTNDVLSVSIKAVDAKLVEIFNPGSALESKTEQALYFDGFTVDDHGNIRLPILGEMNVLGYTTDDIRQKVEKELLETYFKAEASIFVTVKLAGMRFTVNGEVAAPGTKVLFQDKVNVLEAVANSGDITITGDRKNVVIVRQYPQGTEMHTIDLTDSKVMQSPYFYLQPNDYVYIKPLKQKSWGTGKTGIESLTTVITVLSLATTTFLLLKN